MKLAPYIFLTLMLGTAACADDSAQGNIYFSGYTPNILQLKPASDYTILDATKYQRTVNDSRIKIQLILNELQILPEQNTNKRIAFIARQLSDIPYIFSGAMGEGDWQPSSSIYQPGAVHVRQDPVYRLDGLDCQTFVQVAMGLFYSHDSNQFDKNILKISYGAAGNPSGEIVHYYNRNNFIDADWNPLNQHHGWLTDVTAKSDLAAYAKTTSATITRQKWFSFQQNYPSYARVLTEADGPAMAKRFLTTYTTLNYPNFDSENISIAYLPKEKIAIQQSDGSYQPNQDLLDKIPTPAVVEIVRDAKKWTIGGKNIKEVIGSELSISHMGLLYRKRFHHGDLIYRKISCNYDDKHQKICNVTPIVCQQKHCNELMYVHATDSHPNDYFWYKQPDGNYTCSSQPPTNHIGYTKCNRVEQQPLFNYLTDYQYGSYWYMNSPSILGVHVEKLS